MREFNTREAEGEYSITFETNDRKAFEQVQTLCRILVDGKDGDAIPIEWIESYVGKICADDGGRYSSKAYGIERMIDDWKKENETSRLE